MENYENRVGARTKEDYHALSTRRIEFGIPGFPLDYRSDGHGLTGISGDAGSGGADQLEWDESSAESRKPLSEMSDRVPSTGVPSRHHDSTRYRADDIHYLGDKDGRRQYSVLYTEHIREDSYCLDSR